MRKDPLRLVGAVAIGVAVVLFVAMVAYNTFYRSDRIIARTIQDAATPDEVVSDLLIPPFAMTAQDGSSVTSDAFKGHVTVLDFTFTRCTLICPKMTGTMFELTQRLREPSVQFISISVDPEHDTPAVLAEKAKAFDASGPRWRFLCGEKAAVYSMLREGLKFGIKENPPIALPDGTTAPDIRHPAHFVLVGPDGRVLGMYDSNDEEAVGRLEKRARAVAGKMGR